MTSFAETVAAVTIRQDRGGWTLLLVFWTSVMFALSRTSRSDAPPSVDITVISLVETETWGLSFLTSLQLLLLNATFGVIFHHFH